MYIFGLVLLFCTIRYAKSEGGSDSVRWLSKCCPAGKHIDAAGDGKSCVTDTTATLYYPSPTDTAGKEDVLLATERNETVAIPLVYKGEFNCERPEVYVIQDDLHVTEDDRVSVEDESGDTWTLNKSEVCVDSVEGLTVPRVFLALLCPDCERVACLHKCCPESQQLQVAQDGVTVECTPTTNTSWSHHFLPTPDRPFVFHGFPECESMYLDFPERALGLSKHGHLRLRRMTVPRGEYCADSSDRGHALLGCRQLLAASASFKPTLYGSMFCLGSTFLAITLVLHLWLPELRKSLHSRVLVAHVACLLVSYLGLALVNLATLPAPSPLCSATAFVIQFSVLAAMFWLNVMCVDIAWTFSNVRAPKASPTMDSDSHKFLYYSLYVWCCTAAIFTVTAVLEYTDLIPQSSHYKPAFGTTSCWFQHWESVLMLLYLPMAILLMMNIALFTYTANSIRKTQRDAANLVQHVGTKLRENTDRFSVYLKLFGLMGVTWVFEIVSWMVGGPESYWYFTDFINALRGVFIFILFCLKRKVILLIKSKFVKSGPKFPIHSRKSVSSSKLNSSITSQRTNSIQLSHMA